MRNSNISPNTRTAGKGGIVLEARKLGIRLPKGRGMARLWSRGHWAFRDVSFTLKRGETVALLGHNGSGKSTLLRTLAGILAPNEGEVRIAAGLSATILAPGAGFSPHMTGRENILNVALYHGFMPRDIAAHTEEIIEFSEIGSWVDQPVGVYSAGMRARLGFALSLYLPADILMIDETLSAGDARFREKARAAVHDMLNSNQSVIVVSHNPETLRGMCDRALLLDGGRVVSQGRIDEVLEIYDGLYLDDGVTLPVGSADAGADVDAALEADDPDELINHAERDLARARVARAATARTREAARDHLDQLLDELETVTASTLSKRSTRVDASALPEQAGTELEAALDQLASTFEAFVTARADLKRARAADLDKLHDMDEARNRLSVARHSKTDAIRR